MEILWLEVTWISLDQTSHMKTHWLGGSLGRPAGGLGEAWGMPEGGLGEAWGRPGGGLRKAWVFCLRLKP